MATRRSAALAVAAMALVSLLVHSPARSAAPSTVISGQVADATAAPIAGARVTLSGDGIGISRLTTDERGRYRFPGIPAKHIISVAAERAGFRTVRYEGILTEPGRTRFVNFRLKQPGDIEVVALVTRDPFPYDDFVRGLEARVGAPVRVVDLDHEPDPADAVRRVRAEHPNLIVATGLRAARLVRREAPDVPAILTLITDPRRHDLQTESNGILMSQPDPEKVFERVTSVLPGTKRIGLLYQAETSSLLARDLRDAAEGRGLHVEFGLCRSHADIVPSLNAMLGRVDVVVVPNDDLTSTPRAQDIITGWALKNHVALAAPSPEWVAHGALLSYGPSYERLGRETSAVAALILRGEKHPADFQVLRPKEFDLTVNRTTATQLGLEIPNGLTVDAVY